MKSRGARSCLFILLLSNLSYGKERIYLVCTNNTLGQGKNNADARDCEPHSYWNILVQRLTALPNARVVAAVVPRHEKVRECKLKDKVRQARSGLWRQKPRHCVGGSRSIRRGS